VPADTLQEVLPVKAGDRYVRAQVQAAEKALVRELRARDFYEADVSSSWNLSGAESAGTLRFTIDAGPAFVLTFTGNHHLSDRALLALMDLAGRPIITDGTWRELARRARHAYQEAGYYFATVDVRVEATVPKVVRFTINEGEPFHIATVQFEGNHGLSAAQLDAVMATHPPTWLPYRSGILVDDVLDDDLRRLWYLYRRHGFESAEIVDARRAFAPDRGTIALTVIIEEGPQTIVERIEDVGMETIIPPTQSAPESAVTAGVSAR